LKSASYRGTFLKLILVISFILGGTNVWGHGEKDHSQKETKSEVLFVETDKSAPNYRVINEQYLKTVKTIFKRSCFNCHGRITHYPWYYKIPGIKQLIDHDIREAKEHLDFSNDFPFKSHETPLEDLKAISTTLKDESMPPFRYRMMHGESKLTKEEIQKVERWIKKSRELLK